MWCGIYVLVGSPNPAQLKPIISLTLIRCVKRTLPVEYHGELKVDTDICFLLPPQALINDWLTHEQQI